MLTIACHWNGNKLISLDLLCNRDGLYTGCVKPIVVWLHSLEWDQKLKISEGEKGLKKISNCMGREV